MLRLSFVMIVLTAASLLQAANAPAPARAPTPATSAPATRRIVSVAEMEPLHDGSIRYSPPPAPQWKLVGKSDNNLKAVYQTADDGRGRIDITVSPQNRDVPDEYAKQMAMIIGKGIREDADRKGRTILAQPRVIKDDRFFLKIHDRLSGEAGISDRLQLYRVMGLNIVHVAVIALKDTPEEARPIHEVAEELLATMRLTRGQTPVVYPRNRLKIKPPIDWKENKTDVPNGQVVLYFDPEQPQRQLIVRARVIPKDAREDPTKREALIDKMVDEERRTTPFDKLKQAGEEQPLAGGGPVQYLRQSHVAAEGEVGGGGAKLRVQTRYFVVRDEILVSLRSVGAAEDEALLKLADSLAEDVKPSRE